MNDTPGVLAPSRCVPKPGPLEGRLSDAVFYDLWVTFSFTSAALRLAVVRTVSPAAFVADLATSAAERAMGRAPLAEELLII